MTHLGVCPMSEELIKIPVELAAEYDFPVIFITSRNQVSEEEGGGYVMGLTPETFLRKIEDIEKSLGLNSKPERAYLRLVGVDHCGPWYRAHEKSLGEKEAIEAIKQLNKDLGIPGKLRDVGVEEDKIAEMARLAFEANYNRWNPRYTTEHDFLTLFQSAF